MFGRSRFAIWVAEIEGFQSTYWRVRETYCARVGNGRSVREMILHSNALNCMREICSNCRRAQYINSGSSGLPVVDKLVIPRQDSSNEFFPIFGRGSHYAPLVHGFLMR
jgi:hypothetical protein